MSIKPKVTKEEALVRSKEQRRARYASDPEYRARMLAKNKAYRDKHKDRISDYRRLRWKSDDEYRERQLAGRRGKCKRWSSIKHSYGILQADYQALLDSQGGVCAICRRIPPDHLCIDHCHTTGRIRGLLCRKCNTGLGCYEDNPELMNMAINYLALNK
jgi:hypothetical protein